ncbi:MULTISPECIES: hypothetical protein [unclassified Methylobacterium]|jgi:hypothetical protein|uniref:hypothetical protein n=1 Tax=unclassified Methylobacterium TaxID=2615210 RepID=UPI001352991D|nr:hypothetical protein [Methylobacterium sp. 2A]MWV22555.1 hypothetical protein [Methylobacterium sp. 2A]
MAEDSESATVDPEVTLARSQANANNYPAVLRVILSIYNGVAELMDNLIDQSKSKIERLRDVVVFVLFAMPAA